MLHYKCRVINNMGQKNIFKMTDNMERVEWDLFDM